MPAMWLRKNIVQWTSLKRIRSLGVSKYYSSLVFVIPAAATANMAADKYYGLSIDAPTNSVILYFSCLFYYLGTFLFDQFCPKAIRDYEGRFRFVEDWAAHSDRITAYQRQAEARSREILDRTFNGPQNVDIADRSASTKLVVAYEEMFANIAEAKAIGALDDIWSDNNDSRPFRRGLVQLAFTVSAGLAAYITFYDMPVRVLIDQH